MDINVIKKRRQEIKEGGGKSSGNLWKPEPGKNYVRMVPYKHNEENPFSEIYWHFNINKKHFLCLNRNFGEQCPVCKLASDMWNSEDNQDKELAKKMFANMSFYIPIIVRDKEEEGVKFWKINKTIYEALTEPLMEGEIDDFTDIETGRDIIVTRKTPKETNTTWGKTTASLSMKSSPMIPDEKNTEELLNKILEEQEEIFEVLKNSRLEYDNVKTILEDWFKVDDNDVVETSNNNNTNNEPETSDDVDDIMSKFKNIIDTDNEDEK